MHICFSPVVGGDRSGVDVMDVRAGSSPCVGVFLSTPIQRLSTGSGTPGCALAKHLTPCDCLCPLETSGDGYGRLKTASTKFRTATKGSTSRYLKVTGRRCCIGRWPAPDGRERGRRAEGGDRTLANPFPVKPKYCTSQPELFRSISLRRRNGATGVNHVVKELA